MIVALPQACSYAEPATVNVVATHLTRFRGPALRSHLSVSSLCHHFAYQCYARGALPFAAAGGDGGCGARPCHREQSAARSAWPARIPGHGGRRHVPPSSLATARGALRSLCGHQGCAKQLPIRSGSCGFRVMCGFQGSEVRCGSEGEPGRRAPETRGQGVSQCGDCVSEDWGGGWSYHMYEADQNGFYGQISGAKIVGCG